MADEHEKSAKFWVIDIVYVNTYHVLHCVRKTNDFTLFGYALFQLSSNYFSINHHNYARCTILYALEMLNLKPENPRITEMLRNGGFTNERTGNSFGNVGLGIALEQTINAETRNMLKVIMTYADISTAVNSCMTTNSMRSEFVSQDFEIVNLDQVIDVAKELH